MFKIPQKNGKTRNNNLNNNNKQIFFNSNGCGGKGCLFNCIIRMLLSISASFFCDILL